GIGRYRSGGLGSDVRRVRDATDRSRGECRARQGTSWCPRRTSDPANGAHHRSRPGIVGRRQMTIDIAMDWAKVFSHPWWVYVSIPLGAAFVGWATKILALKMMFYPVEFVGIKPYLGWQGQIPKRAPKMAAVAVDSLTSGIINPEQIFDQIDPD